MTVVVKWLTSTRWLGTIPLFVCLACSCRRANQNSSTHTLISCGGAKRCTWRDHLTVNWVVQVSAINSCIGGYEQKQVCIAIKLVNPILSCTKIIKILHAHTKFAFWMFTCEQVIMRYVWCSLSHWETFFNHANIFKLEGLQFSIFFSYHNYRPLFSKRVDRFRAVWLKLLMERFRCAWFRMKHVALYHAWVQGPWFDFEPRTWTTLKVSFQCGLKHAAFLCISRPFVPLSPKCVQPALWNHGSSPKLDKNGNARELTLPTSRETVLGAPTTFS